MKFLFELGLPFLAVIFTVVNPVHAVASPPVTSKSAATCANLLATGGYKVILRQANDLGILDSPSEPVPLEQLYLKLKDAEYSKLSADELRATLLAARQKHFAIEGMSAKELRQFYENSVNALYVRVAALWYVQEVRTQVGPVMRTELEQTLARLLAREFSPWSLEDRDLKPAAAREHLRERSWMRWPWVKLAAFMTEWIESRGDANFSSSEFGKFWDSRAQSYGLKYEFYQKLYLALNRVAEAPACCHSEPGCVTCPHNRRWLK